MTPREANFEDSDGITRSRHVWAVVGPDPCILFALRCQPIDAGANALVITPEDLRAMLDALEVEHGI